MRLPRRGIVPDPYRESFRSSVDEPAGRHGGDTRRRCEAGEGGFQAGLGVLLIREGDAVRGCRGSAFTRCQRRDQNEGVSRISTVYTSSLPASMAALSTHLTRG